VDISVADNEHLHRYEATVDGKVAGFLRYLDRPQGVRVLVHTEVEPAYEGKGVGGRLVAGALDAERARGGKIVPECPFVKTYLKRHPEYGDLVAGDPA
jgi:predicted GNAT family acetyltransferase